MYTPIKRLSRVNATLQAALEGARTLGRDEKLAARFEKALALLPALVVAAASGAVGAVVGSGVVASGASPGAVVGEMVSTATRSSMP